MRYFSILVFCLLFSVTIRGQEASIHDKITLKTGEIYTGEIVVKNDEMIMLKSTNGTRYQFPLSEISKIEKEDLKNNSIAVNNAKSEIATTTGNISGILEFAGGISSAKNCFDPSTNSQVSLIFGNKSVLGQQVFLGFGLGLNATFETTNSSTIAFLPLFLRLQTTLSKNKIAPFLGMDAGYAFALNEEFGGGPFAKVSFGINYKLTYKTALLVGIYAGVNSISANQIDTNGYSYYGNTSMTGFGIKAGLQF